MYDYKAIVVNVVDGDTFDADVSLGLYLSARLRFRVLGINAPEMHAPDPLPGRAAKAYAASRLLSKPVILTTRKSDDFGRWLASVEIEGVDFGQEMIAKGYAVPFMV